MKKNLKLVFVLIFLITSAVLFSGEVSIEGLFRSPFPPAYQFTILNEHEMKFEWSSFREEFHYCDQSKIYQYVLSKAKDSVFFRLKLDDDIPMSLWEPISGEKDSWEVGDLLLGLFGVVEDTGEVMGVTYSTKKAAFGSDVFTVDIPAYYTHPPQKPPLYCGNSSSELKEGDVTYELRNLYSAVSDRTWVEGVEGNGIGESFEIAFNEQPQYLALINGYISAQNPSLYWKNGRIKTVRIEGLTTGTVIERNLEDTPNPQTIDVRELGDETHARFVIADVYPGECYTDTCLHLLTYSPYPIRPLSVP